MRPPHAALVVVALLVTSGCLGFGGSSQPPSDERALDALDRAQDALADVDSYRATIDGHAEARANDETITVDLSGNETANVSARQVIATAKVSGDRGSPVRSGTRVTYINSSTAYSECSRLGWGRHNLSESHSWVTYTTLGQQLELMNRSNVYWQGTETLDGTETAVIVAHPTKEVLDAVPDVQSSSPTNFDETKVENASVTAWVGNDTGRLLQAKRDFEVSSAGATATVTATIRFTDYNQLTSITAPDIGDAVWKTGCPGD